MISVPLTVLLAEGPRQTGPDFGKASPAGLVITLILLIAVIGLIWSMNRHLRKLPESFDPAHPEPDQAVDDGSTKLIDYVIAHELIHIPHPNHSPTFWSNLGRVMPDYEQRRDMLRKIGAGLVW